MDIHLTQGLQRALQQAPQRTATVCGGRRQDFARLADRVSRLAGALRAQGVQPGECVALLALNSDWCVEAFLAAWWAGAVPCPINTRWSEAEMLHALRDCDARVLLVDADFAAQGPALARQLPALRALWHLGAGAALAGVARVEELIAATAPVPDARRGGDALATILYTGGTTGAAKGVMLSHANLWTATMARLAELPSYGTALLTTPLFHVAGLGRLVSQLVLGGTSVIEPMFRPQAFLQAVHEHGVDDVVLVPSMLQILLDDPAFDAARLRGLKRITHGAAPMPVALLRRAMQALPHVQFCGAYGMTESSAVATLGTPVTWADAERHADRLGSVGHAGLASEVRICDPDGAALPAGAIGEICVRGPTVMLGYWRRPEETAQALRGGWLHTGDGGWLDGHGQLFIADRLKDMIITGGENVYSAEVESVLMQHPQVALCAVVGLPDATWGEAVHAVVVPRPGPPPSAEQLRAHCRTQLAGFKCPRGISVAESLPMSPAGKILKNRLRESLARAGG
ncbi:long-chain acyl-CoA synthetase [Oryzisolibacter propanilivorax]|uniref:Long-chain acyl-CoA synthetase n=1 Tax=Oryzisolibacter propanilivorax TaxID=1527607 RepID=A0A1G9QDB3_9BURK|nr:AMP-binding protein [Oryzisolibacter propanilivorax]SDM08477.1 long-chain acyl-CoA synthetase [Oryzisolibacter propanilivorax]